MSQVLSKTSWDRATFEQFLQSRQEPSWLTELRQQAWQVFEESAWPSRKEEEWMRSDLRAFQLDRYPLGLVEPEPIDAPVRLLEGVDAAGTMRIVDGHVESSSLLDVWKNRGVIFGSLDDLVQTHGEKIREYLFRSVDPHQDRFAALHAAAWRGGSVLIVPRNVTLSQPLHVLSSMRDGGCDLGHTLIVLEEGAEATFLQECSSPQEHSHGFHCGALEIVVKPGANLRYVNLQDWGRDVWHFAYQRASVDRDASLQWTIAGMGAKFAQVSQAVSLVGPGAYSQVNGVMFTQDRQQMTYNTLQHHQAPQCRSDFLYKAALQDRSRTVWRGMIEVDPGAFKTDGYQRNDNLLLSEHARADSIPGLEILADDVRCTHGSTSGKVDEELIFYAQSRGFTRHEATRMIVSGFFQQIFDRIPIESVREALGHTIARKVRQYD